MPGPLPNQVVAPLLTDRVREYREGLGNRMRKQWHSWIAHKRGNSLTAGRYGDGRRDRTHAIKEGVCMWGGGANAWLSPKPSGVFIRQARVRENNVCYAGGSEYRGRGEQKARSRVLLAKDHASSYVKGLSVQIEGSDCMVSKAQQWRIDEKER